MSWTLREVETHIGRDYPRLLSEWEAQVIAAETAKAQWEAAATEAAEACKPVPPKPASATPPPEPPRPTARVSSVTIEKLSAILAAQPKGVLCAQDELANWLANLNRYSGGSDRPFWLEAYVGGPFRIDRVRSPQPILIPHLSVPIFGTIQPDRLAEIWKGADDGLVSRFLWTWPEARPFRRPRATLETRQATEAMCRLADLQMTDDVNGLPTPIYIPLTEAAARSLEQFGFRCKGWSSRTMVC